MSHPPVTFRDTTIDGRLLRCGTEAAQCDPQEAIILRLLMRCAPDPVSVNAIRAELYGNRKGPMYEEAAIAVKVSNCRAALSGVRAGFRIAHRCYGSYRLVVKAPVKVPRTFSKARSFDTKRAVVRSRSELITALAQLPPELRDAEIEKTIMALGRQSEAATA